MVQYKEPLTLQEVIQRVVDLMRVEAENKKIDLQFSSPLKVPLINADRNSMEGIFTNSFPTQSNIHPKEERFGLLSVRKVDL
jgi:signal transduction histidine kinase